MNNSLLNRFTPKEPKFFHFLKQVSEIYVVASELLADAIQAKTVDERREFFRLIKVKEHEADALSRDIFDALSSSFITPFDREDIHDMADCLDDMVDYVNSCAKRIAIYNPKHNGQVEVELGKIIIEFAKCVDNAMASLPQLKRHSEKIKQQIELLHTLENKADEIYEDAITLLFAEETNPIELLKTKEILSELEKTTDAAERLGKVLKTIIVKYA